MSRITTFISGLLIYQAIVGIDSAFGIGEIGRHQICFEYLAVRDSIQKIQPFIPWDAISGKVRNYNVTTGWLGEKVFLKMEGMNELPDNHLFNLVEISKELSDAKVGPRFIGSTFDPQSKTWSLIFEFVEGSLYMPNYRFYDSPKARLQVEVARPNYQIPDGIKVEQGTIRDINKAFDVLNSLKIKANDVQFLLTGRGRAILVDYEAYERVSSSVAKKYNEKLRQAVLAGLMAGH